MEGWSQALLHSQASGVEHLTGSLQGARLKMSLLEGRVKELEGMIAQQRWSWVSWQR
jgi:hypothetical protein